MSMPYTHEIKLTRPERYTTMPESGGEWTLDRCLAQVVTLTYHEVVSLLYWAAEVGRWTSKPSFILFDGSSDQLKRRAFDIVFYQGSDQDERGLEYDRFTALWELWISADTTTRAKLLLAFHQDEAYREHVYEWLNQYDVKRESQAQADEAAGIYERGTDDEIDYDDRSYDFALLRTYGARMWGTRYYAGYGPNGKIEGGAEGESDAGADDAADETDEDEGNETFEESTAGDSPAGVHAEVITGEAIADEVGGVDAEGTDEQGTGEECDGLSVDDEDDLLEAVNAFTLAQTNDDRESAKRAVIEIMEQRPMRVVECDADNGFPAWQGFSLPHGVGEVPATPAPAPATRPSFERFTDRARRVMQFANQEAQRLNHKAIGTEHILLGLARGWEGVAAKVLNSFALEPADIRSKLERLIQPGPELVTMGKLPLTPRAKKVVELANEEAVIEERGTRYIAYVGTEHLLLGLLREGEGIASHVLGGMGLQVPAVRTMVLLMTGRPERAAANPDYELQPVEAGSVPATV